MEYSQKSLSVRSLVGGSNTIGERRGLSLLYLRNIRERAGGDSYLESHFGQSFWFNLLTVGFLQQITVDIAHYRRTLLDGKN